ncbi:unnamed protein product, partial [Brassica rapa]
TRHICHAEQKRVENLNSKARYASERESCRRLDGVSLDLAGNRTAPHRITLRESTYPNSPLHQLCMLSPESIRREIKTSSRNKTSIQM